ncbi:hypothetical protein CJU89_6086 [Yarrowia sp. B02]|nr:hypothetical protein CJU89_6086 [Yarrowia sp. B02]
MDWEGNEWADSEWKSAEPVEEDATPAFEPLPSGSPAAVLTPEIDDIHAWGDVLEERSSPRPASKGDAEEQGTTEEAETADSEAEVSKAVQQLQLESEDEAEDLKDTKPNALGLVPPISMSSISVDDPHWGSDVEPEVEEKEKKTDTTEAATESEPTAPATAPVAALSPEDEGWGKAEDLEPVSPVAELQVEPKPVSPVAELQEGWADAEPEVKATEEEATAKETLPEVEDEGWGDGGDGGDWGDFEEGDGFDDPVPTPAPVTTTAPPSKKTASTPLDFPQPLEELVGQLRGSESAKVEEKGADTPILSYREKSRKLYNSLIRPNCQFIESKRGASEDNVVKWRGSEFEKILKGEIQKLHENDSKNLKRVFKFGWSNGGERSGSRGRPLSMPPPKNNEPVQIPGLSRSSTMSRASTASPAPPSGGLTRSSSLRERGRDMTRNKPPGLVQTAIAGAVGQRVASNSPSMSPSMSPSTSHHHHALSSVFGSSKSKTHSKSSSVSSVASAMDSPIDSPMDSPMDSPLGSPVLTNLAPTLSPTLTGTPPSGPSRTATPVNSAPAAPEEDSFADFISATPVASTHNSPISSPKIGSPVTSPKLAQPQISSPLAANGSNDLLGMDLLGSSTAATAQPSQSNALDDFFGSTAKATPSKPAESPLDDFFGSRPVASNPAVSKPAESPLDDFFGASAKAKPAESKPAESPLDDFFGSTAKPAVGKPAESPLDDFFASSKKPETKSTASNGSASTSGNQLDDIFGSSGASTAAPAHKNSDFDIFTQPKETKPAAPASSDFDIFNSAPAQPKQPAALEPSNTGLSGFEVFDKPSAPSIQIDSSQAEDDEWGDFTDSVATSNRPRKNSYNSAAGVPSNSRNVPSSEVAQSISQSSTSALFDTTFLDSAMSKRHKSKSPARSPVAPMKLAKKPVAFELDMGPLQPGSKYKQQSEDKLVSDIVSSLPNLDFLTST